MKSRILLGITCLSAFFIYQNFPKYYFSPEPTCVASCSDLHGKAYEQAVLDYLKDRKPSDFRYFFQTFTQVNENNYMVVNMRHANACFDVKMRVQKWDKLAGMKRTNGIGYPKELYNLQWKLTQQAGSEEVLLEDMHTIID